MEENREGRKAGGTYWENDDISKEINNFAYRVMERMNAPKDYGTGELMRMVDAHILTLIADNPGITVVEVAKAWDRTSGRISQVVSSLVKRGFVERRKEPGNAKNVHLYATEKGIALSKAHKSYDSRRGEIGQQVSAGKYTEEEGKIFRKVLRALIEYYESGK